MIDVYFVEVENCDNEKQYIQKKITDFIQFDLYDWFDF